MKNEAGRAQRAQQISSKKKGEGNKGGGRVGGEERGRCTKGWREERGEREGEGASACRMCAHLLEIEEEGKD